VTTETKRGHLGQFAGGATAGLAVGYVAALLQTIRAPVGLFPLATGIVTGALVGAVAKSAGGGRLAVFLAATVASGACLATVHYFSYRQAKAAIESQNATLDELRAKFPDTQAPIVTTPELTGFRDYLEREWEIGRKLGPLPVRGSLLLLWWFIDALLLWVGACVTALIIGKPGPSPTRPEGATA
jgi:hypothetical protein